MVDAVGVGNVVRKILTFVCLDKLGSGDLATTVEMISALVIHPDYAHVEINLVSFGKDPVAQLSRNSVVFRRSSNLVYVKTQAKQAALSMDGLETHELIDVIFSKTTHSDLIGISNLTQLLDKSDAIIFYPRTPGEADRICGWREVYNATLKPHEDKMIFVTEPCGFANIEEGFFASKLGMHLGFHERSVGVPYPIPASESEFNPREQILVENINHLKLQNGAKVFFIYGHKEEHLTNFFITIATSNEATTPVIFVILGFEDYREQMLNGTMTGMREVALARLCGMKFTCKETTYDMQNDSRFNWLNERRSWISEHTLMSNVSVPGYYCLPLKPVSSSCFSTLMALSETIVGCTGAHSLATAISLNKLPLYEALYDYHRNMIIDLMSINDFTKANPLTYILLMDNFHLTRTHRFVSLMTFTPAFRFRSWEELRDSFLQVALPENISIFCEDIRRKTDLIKRFPVKLLELIRELDLRNTVSERHVTSYTPALFSLPSVIGQSVPVAAHLPSVKF